MQYTTASSPLWGAEPVELTNLNKEQVYRWVGYRSDCHTITPELDGMVEDCIREVLETARPKAVFSPLLPIEGESGAYSAAGLPLMGQDMAKHLEHCQQVLLLAVTLGAPLDMRIRRTEAVDMARAVVLDSAANVAVEEAAWQAEDEMRMELSASGLYLTGRYSPGYGDYPISVQKELLRLTDAGRKIGLSVTPSHIMTPRKSITAVLGAAKIPVKGHLAGCRHCVLQKTCLFRKRGTSCVVSD